MAVSADVAELRRQILTSRVTNCEFKHFVPEERLSTVVTEERVSKIVSRIFPFESSDKVLNFVINGAQKIFSILVLIDHVSHISHFITGDQMQRRPVDNLLPLHMNALRNTLDDKVAAAQFYEKQWEFCAPFFPKEIMPRALEVPTILPYLSDSPLASGGYGIVHVISIHQSHRPDGYSHVEEASAPWPEGVHSLMQRSS